MPSPAASRKNLANARNCGQIKLRRCLSETQIIKLLIWQAYFSAMDGARPSQRALARQLGVSQPYVCKVIKKAHPVGWDALVREGPVTLADLDKARRVTANIREREPDLFAPAPEPRPSDESRVLTADESIAETWRIAREEQRRHPYPQGSRRRTFSSVSPWLRPTPKLDFWDD